MRRAPLRASVALLLYLTWLAPAAAMLGAVAHDGHHAHDEHDDHDDRGQPELALELAKASTHGHHHEAATPAHDHDAVRPAGPTATTPAAWSAPPAPPTVDSTTPAGAGFARRPPPTGSPPLFRSHCALLL